MRLEQVGKRYGRRGPAVLHGVTLELPGSGTVRVDGANGSGKSTLLRLVAGATRPSTGRVVDRPRRTSYAPERFDLAVRLTAEGYLAHVSRLRGLGREAVARAAATTGLTPWLGTPVPDLSKGNRQRLVLAQALLADVDLLVLDEPFSGLDADGRLLLQESLHRRVADGATVVLTDHEQHGGVDAVLRLRVEQGRVLVDDAATRVPLSTLRVRGPVDPAGLPPSLGPVTVLPDGDATSLRLPDDRVDALLRHLLAQGAYLTEVRRCSP